MSTYIIGDIHGCYEEFCILLETVSFNPNTDDLWLTGDLVARGPDSLKVLRYVKSLDKNVRIVLGNHDIRLLCIYAGIKFQDPNDYLISLLEAHDANELISWLRHQPLYHIDKEKKLIMVHAGIPPQWDLETMKFCTHEVKKEMSSISYPMLLKLIYNKNIPNWSQTLTKSERLCFSINALTRMRFCFPNGQLNMMYNCNPNSAPLPLKPWFLIPGKIDKKYTIIFGHWASLEGKGTPHNIIGLDTGCCWGGYLTMLHWEKRKYYTQKYKIK